MSEQTINIRRADEITVGQHISNHNGVHELVHRCEFNHGETPMIALTLRPLATGVPFLTRYATDDEVRVATDDEIREYEEQGRRRTLAHTLGELADQITDHGLSVGRLEGDLTLFLDNDGQLAAWAKALDVEVGETTTGGWPCVRKNLPGLSVKAYGQQPSRAAE